MNAILGATLTLRLFLLLAAAVFSATAANSQTNSLAGNIPGGAYAFVEATDLADLIGDVRSSQLLRDILQSEDFAQLREKKWYQELESSRKMAEFVLRMNIWEASAKLLGGRLGFAVYPSTGTDGEPELTFLIRPSEPSDWLKKRVWSAPLLKVGLKRIERIAYGNQVAAYRTRGLPSKATYFALHNDWIAVASNADLLKKTVVLQRPEKVRLGEPGPRIGDEPPYQRMTKRMGSTHFFRAFLDTQRLAKLAKSAGPNLGLPDDPNDPMLGLFLGGVSELLDNSRFAGFALDLNDTQLRFKAGIDARPKDVAEEYRIFFSDNPSTSMRPPPAVSGLIGGFSLYRQFGSWYRERGDVMKDSIIPGVEGFQGNIGDILLGQKGAGGKSIIGDKIAFVAAMRDDAGTEPNGAALPGFAFAVDLAVADGDVDETVSSIFDAVLEEIRGPKNEKLKWAHSSEEFEGVKIKYAVSKSGSRKLVPAIARVENQLVVSSSRRLCRDLITTLKKGAGSPDKGKDLIFQLHSAPLESLLKTNRKSYYARLIKDGRSPKQANDDLQTIKNILDLFSTLSGNTTAANGIFELEVRGKLKPLK